MGVAGSTDRRCRLGRLRPGEVVRARETGTARFSGRIRGLPGPSGTCRFTITADRLVFGTPIAGAARWSLELEGSATTHRQRHRPAVEGHTSSPGVSGAGRFGSVRA